MDTTKEQPPPEFLRALAEKLRHVPGTYGIDDGDIDELIHIARMLEGKEEMYTPLLELHGQTLRPEHPKDATDVAFEHDVCVARDPTKFVDLYVGVHGRKHTQRGRTTLTRVEGPEEEEP